MKESRIYHITLNFSNEFNSHFHKATKAQTGYFQKKVAMPIHSKWRFCGSHKYGNSLFLKVPSLILVYFLYLIDTLIDSVSAFH